MCLLLSEGYGLCFSDLSMIVWVKIQYDNGTSSYGCWLWCLHCRRFPLQLLFRWSDKIMARFRFILVSSPNFGESFASCQHYYLFYVICMIIFPCNKLNFLLERALEKNISKIPVIPESSFRTIDSQNHKSQNRDHKFAQITNFVIFVISHQSRRPPSNL